MYGEKRCMYFILTSDIQTIYADRIIYQLNREVKFEQVNNYLKINTTVYFTWYSASKVSYMPHEMKSGRWRAEEGEWEPTLGEAYSPFYTICFTTVHSKYSYSPECYISSKIKSKHKKASKHREIMPLPNTLRHPSWCEFFLCLTGPTCAKKTCWGHPNMVHES